MSARGEMSQYRFYRHRGDLVKPRSRSVSSQIVCFGPIQGREEGGTIGEGGLAFHGVACVITLEFIVSVNSTHGKRDYESVVRIK